MPYSYSHQTGGCGVQGNSHGIFVQAQGQYWRPLRPVMRRLFGLLSQIFCAHCLPLGEAISYGWPMACSGSLFEKSLMRALLTLLACLPFTLAALTQAETFKVGVELQPYLPYSNVQDGQYLGYGRDLLDAFAAHQGHEFIYQPLPVRRLLSDFLNDRVDFKYPDNPRWNADQKKGYALHYSQAAAPAIDGVLVKPEFLGQGSARLHRLGTQRGFTPWPYLDEIKAGKILLIQANQIDSLLAMAMSDRIDGVYLNPQVIQHQFYNSAEKSLVFDPKLPYQDDHYFLSSIRHPEVIKQFDAFLSSQAELVQMLKDRHGISDPLSGQ